MFILIDEKGALSLKQHDDFKGFSIVDRSVNKHHQALLQIAETAEDNHYWIEADAVVALSPAQNDEVWVDSFWKMLASAEPYGYSDMKRKKVKAHIDQK